MHGISNARNLNSPYGHKKSQSKVSRTGFFMLFTIVFAIV